MARRSASILHLVVLVVVKDSIPITEIIQQKIIGIANKT